MQAGKPVGDPGNGAPTFGESWMTVPELNPYRLAEGHAPTGPNEIVIDRRYGVSGAQSADILLQALEHHEPITGGQADVENDQIGMLFL